MIAVAGAERQLELFTDVHSTQTRKIHPLTSILQKIGSIIRRIWQWVKSFFCKERAAESICQENANRPRRISVHHQALSEDLVFSNYRHACLSFLSTCDGELKEYHEGNEEFANQSKDILAQGLERLYHLITQSSTSDMIDLVINPLKGRVRHEDAVSFGNKNEDVQRIQALLFPDIGLDLTVSGGIGKVLPFIRSYREPAALKSILDGIYLASAKSYAIRLQDHLYVTNIHEFSKTVLDLYRLRQEKENLDQLLEGVDGLIDDFKKNLILVVQRSEFREGAERLVGDLKQFTINYFQERGVDATQLKAPISRYVRDHFAKGAFWITENLQQVNFNDNLREIIETITQDLETRSSRLIDEMVNKLTDQFATHAPNYWKGDIEEKTERISTILKRDLEIDFEWIRDPENGIESIEDFEEYRRDAVRNEEKRKVRVLGAEEQSQSVREVAELALDLLNSKDFGDWGSRLLRWRKIRDWVAKDLADNISYTIREYYSDGTFIIELLTDLFNHLANPVEHKEEDGGVCAVEKLSGALIDYMGNTFGYHRLLGGPQQFSAALHRLEERLLGISEDAEEEVKQTAIRANETLVARVQDAFLQVLERTASENPQAALLDERVASL